MGGLAPSLLCAGPFSSAACKNSTPLKVQATLRAPTLPCAAVTSPRDKEQTGLELGSGGLTAS